MNGMKLLMIFNVAPFAGAWIEITFYLYRCTVAGSLPSRERGLKYKSLVFAILSVFVAPFAGAWIEMHCGIKTSQKKTSLPSRERGLKF